ncbi:RidA family protein [Pseudooceanicola algae]|uniref:Aminoacrylate peracid reductase RutC n=1 Tax=Pseudooceanicola algae TaxID=1537215 RepID=A0A418SHQ3_9RHOB|nr:RidA family protein [Pseudooceanicola algae]QPM90259.1 Putative aminoacrylate peracid reductase RutC [Pseudooceanicola algae]
MTHKEALDIGLPTPGQPFSWAIRSGEMIYTTHAAVTPEGGILQEPVEAQAHLTFQHLARTMEVAGGSMADYLQLQIFLVDGADMAIVDKVYAQYFQAPYPNRATLIVAGLVGPGMLIEVTAIGRVPVSPEA